MLGTDKRKKRIFPIQKVHFSNSNLPRYFQNSEKNVQISMKLISITFSLFLYHIVNKRGEG